MAKPTTTRARASKARARRECCRTFPWCDRALGPGGRHGGRLLPTLLTSDRCTPVVRSMNGSAADCLRDGARPRLSSLVQRPFFRAAARRPTGWWCALGALRDKGRREIAASRQCRTPSDDRQLAPSAPAGTERPDPCETRLGPSETGAGKPRDRASRSLCGGCVLGHF